MNRDRIIAAAVAAAVAVGLVATVREADLGERPADTRSYRRSESKLVELEDAGRGYAYPTTLEDGGTEYVVTSDAPCMRRPVGAPVESCLRREPDGGARDFGALNRFPVEEAVGAGCQPVACSVVAGEDPDEDEGVKLERERRRRDAGR